MGKKARRKDGKTNMSGEASGLLVAAPILAVVGVGYAAYGIGKVVWKLGTAGVEYAQNRREEKEARLESEILNDLETINIGMKDSLKMLDAMSDTVFATMDSAVKQQNQCLLEMLTDGDGEAYQDALMQMQDVSNQVYRQIEQQKTEFKKKYEKQVKNEIQKMHVQTRDRMQKVEDILNGLENDTVKKREKARKIALQYIEESNRAYEALQNGFHVGEKDFRIDRSLQKQLEIAKAQFKNENYEAAIATAKDFQMAVVQAVYDLEKKELVLDHAYRMALEAANMVHTYLENQSCFNKEAIDNLADQGIEVPEELLDVELACYADRTADGCNCFLEQKIWIAEILKQLEGDDKHKISVFQLEQLTEEIYTNAYPQALRQVNDAVMNLSNVYYRSQKAGEFMDFLEGKGLDIYEVDYVDEEEIPDYTRPIEIVVKNSVYDEVIVYSFKKQQQGQSPAQVNIEYHLKRGDEHDENRNQYYQRLIREFLGVEIECNTGTVGNLSQHISNVANRMITVNRL